jgi:hypothetical protein
MANDISGRVWILDTPSASTFVLKPPNGWRPRLVEWFNPINVGDSFLITGSGNKEILSGICEVSGQSQLFNLDNWYYGLMLNILDSGVIKIHMK